MSNDVLNQNEVESLLSAMENKAAGASTHTDALVFIT